MTGLQIHWGTFARVLALALVLLFVLRALRFALSITPMSAARRHNLEQAMPVLEVTVGAIYLVAAVREFFSSQPAVATVGTLGVVFGGLWLSRHAMMDFLTGVFLRSSGSVGIGDRVQLDGIQGNVTRLGNQFLALETREGDEALIPYSRLARQSVVRTPLVDGAFRHTFEVRRPEAMTPREAADELRRLALLCHWSSVSRPPIVDPRGDDLAVTVFALDRERGADIEAFVRASLT